MQILETRGLSGGRLPAVQHWDREHLNTEDRQERLGPGRVHPRVLRQLAEVTVGPLCICSWRTRQQGEAAEAWRTEGPREPEAGQPHLGKVVEHGLLEATPKMLGEGR